MDTILLIALLVPILGGTLIASAMVKSRFKKYSRFVLRNGMTGAQIARTILDRHGLHHVRVEPSQGYLTDHYDPSGKVLRLSEPVYRSRSVSAAGVAAHEAGHAIQDATNYAMLRFRSAVVPFAGIGSWLSMPLIIIGLLLSFAALYWVGIALFSVVLLFQLITLPVEFDASARAKRILLAEGLTTAGELRGVDKVLDAAAMTYVAATAQSVAWLVYFILAAAE